MIFYSKFLSIQTKEINMWQDLVGKESSWNSFLILNKLSTLYLKSRLYIESFIKLFLS